MRLIDADKLLETLQDLEPHCDNKKYENWVLKMLRCYMPQIINDEPTAYDVDKVVEELESAENYYCDDKFDEEGDLIMFKAIEQSVAIEIVKQGGVSDDVCEWHKVKNGNAYKCNTHAEIHDSRVLDWCKCPYCGKKIKVVEY